MSTVVIVLIALIVLCAILGAIYTYIYFTRISPKGHRPRGYASEQLPLEENPGNGQQLGASTHVFLFRKS